jgi:hypothetical protein
MTLRLKMTGMASFGCCEAVLSAKSAERFSFQLER